MTEFRFPPLKTFLAAFSVALFGTVPYSYQSVLNQPTTVIKKFVNESYYAHYGTALSSGQLNGLWGFISASICLGGMFGATMINSASEKFGRKTSGLVINSIIVIIGALIQALSKSANAFELLIIGRFITGISTTWAIICSVYLSESAPDFCRGFCSVMVSLMFGFWSMFVTALGLPSVLGSEALWPVLVAYGIPFAVCSIILSRYVPESPKYLYIHKKNQEAASRSVQFFHGNDVDVDSILAEFHRENEMAQNDRDYTFKEIFKHKHLSRAFYITALVYSCCSFCGIDVAYQYSNDVLLSVGLDEKDASLAVILAQIPAVISSCLALWLIEKLGRRKLMFLALTVATIGFILFMASSLSSYFALIGLILIFCSHHGGASPERDIIAGDVCPQGIRAKVAGISMLLGFFVSFVIVVAFPPLEDVIGTYSFSILLVICIVCIVWFWKYLPETAQTAVDKAVHDWLLPEDEKEIQSGHIIT